MKLFSRIFSMLVAAFAFSVLFCAPTFAEESLSISVDGVAETELDPNTFGTSSVDVYVTSTARDGYKLSVSDSDENNSLVSSNGNSINPLTESVTESNFTTNAWGVKVGDNFLPVPKLSDNVLELANISAAATNEKHTITFGMKVDSTAVSGDYSSEVVFTAVANPLVLRRATLRSGQQVNATWKTLAKGSSVLYSAIDNTITSIQKYSGDFTEALRNSAVDIATDDSDWPVYTWFDNGIIYYYTEADEVFFNADSSSMFSGMWSLANINFNFGVGADIDSDGDGIITNVQDPVFITSNVTDMNNMFFLDLDLSDIDVSKWDTSNVTDMSYMFYHNFDLTTLDVSNWDTSNVTDMNRMFDSTTSLTTLDVSNWDTSKVTDMSRMFYQDHSLTILDVSNWDTGNVTDMYGVFERASSFTTLDVSKWDTSNVTNMSFMFYDNRSLTTLDVSNWDTSKVTDMSYMFYQDYVLTTLDVSNWDTSNVTNMGGMFYQAKSLTALDVSNWDTSNVTEMGIMFSYVSSLTTLDVSNWDTSKVTNMYLMFYYDSSLATLDVSNWNTSNVTNMNSMFDNNKSLTTLDVSNWDTSNVTDMRRMFAYVSSLTTLDVSNWDTSKVTDMREMFYYASSLTTIYASESFDTSAVTQHYSVFYGATSLVGGNGTTYSSGHSDIDYARIDAPGAPGYFTEKQRAVRKATLKTGQEVNAAWKTLAKGSNASYTERDEIIKSIKPASNVPATFQAVAVNIATNDSDYPVYAWFEGDTTISLYTDADEVFLNADSCDMFSNLTRLSSINISFGVATDVDPDGDDIIVGRKDPVYITSNVTNMSSIFYSNDALTTLDLSGWDTSSVTNMEYMFSKLQNTTTIYASSLFDTSSVTNSSSMFYGTTSLVGGNGTTYDWSNDDKTYAHIDAPGAPGYFTAKPAGN